MRILTERHQIESTPEIVQLCAFSKLLYNKCNYLMRDAFFKRNKIPDSGHLWKNLKNDQTFLNFTNVAVAQQVMWQCLGDWDTFFKALKAYRQDKAKFNRCPRPPGYKNKLNQLIFNKYTIKGGSSKYPEKYPNIAPTSKLFNVPNRHGYKQIVIVPKTFGFVIEVQYEIKESEIHVEKKEVPGTLCIDLGVNNLAAIISDQLAEPILVNGRMVKSINQQYNKRQNKESSRKRYWRMENYFHHTSKMIIDLCVQNNIGQIIIGKNNGWKTGTNIGKKNNQNFQSIPHYKLIQKIKYKAELAGITVVETEEAYTSQASFLDRDPLPAYQKGVKHTFSGKRINRGLYQASDGRIINADVNGSANIGRKVIQNRNFVSRLDRSLAARPILVNPLKTFCT